tara:strand:- start:443 stop:1324 length:882 start_codon:yes stop_codon:yes gene_type:complete
MEINNFYLNDKWFNIAKGHTAFCVFGGPSVKKVNNIKNIIDNNFTVTMNNNIKLFPYSDLYITGDNPIAREYFEDKDFCLYKFKGGKLLKNQSYFDYKSPMWIKGKRNIILQNPNLIKIIGCNIFPIYNYSFTTGQLSSHHGEEYCKIVPNTYLCIEYRNEQGESWPLLSPHIQESIVNYGINPLKFYPGGNISGLVFQILYYMGFDKLIVVGYGDKGESSGYDKVTQFTWSQEEIHSAVAHNEVWGDKLKHLHGSEIIKEYYDFKQASYSELESTPLKKNQLINKLLKINNG